MSQCFNLSVAFSPSLLATVEYGRSVRSRFSPSPRILKILAKARDGFRVLLVVSFMCIRHT